MTRFLILKKEEVVNTEEEVNEFFQNTLFPEFYQVEKIEDKKIYLVMDKIDEFLVFLVKAENISDAIEIYRNASPGNREISAAPMTMDILFRIMGNILTLPCYNKISL